MLDLNFYIIYPRNHKKKKIIIIIKINKLKRIFKAINKINC